MPTDPTNPFKLTFKSAVNWFRKRLAIPAKDWRAVQGEENAWAFAVASVQSSEMLADFKAALDRYIAEGSGFQQFSKDFREISERYGWQPKQSVAWRANIVASTNLRQAYAAGQYEQRQRPEVKALRPGLRWDWRDSPHPRPHHLAMDGKVFDGNDPNYQNLSAPSGFGCFPAGTMVATPTGWKPIESFQVGDQLIGGSGDIKSVDFVFSRHYDGDLVRIDINGSIGFTATPNHRILTTRGWIRAENLQRCDVLIQLNKLPLFNSKICDVDQTNPLTCNRGMPAPTQREPAISLAFDTQVQFGNENVNPSSASIPRLSPNKLIVNGQKSQFLNVIKHDLFKLGRLNSCIDKNARVLSNPLHPGLIRLGFNLRSMKAGRVLQFLGFSSLNGANVLCSSLPSTANSLLKLPQAFSSLLLALRVVNPLSFNSFAAVPNFNIKTFQKFRNHSVPDPKLFTNFSKRLLLNNISIVQNLRRRLLANSFNFCNYNIFVSATRKSMFVDLGRNIPLRNLPEFSNRTNSHDLLGVSEPEGFVKGAPLDQFNSLDDFLVWSKSHCQLLEISSVSRCRCSVPTIVYNLEVADDQSYCLPSAIVHNCRCVIRSVPAPKDGYFTLSDRLPYSLPDGETISIPAIPVGGKLHPIAEKGFYRATGQSRLDERVAILRGMIDRQPPEMRARILATLPDELREKLG